MKVFLLIVAVLATGFFVLNSVCACKAECCKTDAKSCCLQ